MLNIKKKKSHSSAYVLTKLQVKTSFTDTIYTYKHKLNASKDPRIHQLDPANRNIPLTARNVYRKSYMLLEITKTYKNKISYKNTNLSHLLEHSHWLKNNNRKCDH